MSKDLIGKKPVSTEGGLRAGGVSVVPWLHGMRAGIGYDSEARSVKGFPPVRTPSEFESTLGASGIETSTVEIRRIENVQNLQDALEVKSDVSGSYGLFGASASASFMKSVSLNAYSLYFLVKAVAVVKTEYATQLKLEPAAATESPARFLEMYGDYHVSARQRGSVFYGLIEVKTESQETKSAVLSSLRGSFGAQKLKGNMIEAGFASGLQKAISHEGVSLTLTILAHGVGADLVKLTEDLPPVSRGRDQ